MKAKATHFFRLRLAALFGGDHPRFKQRCRVLVRGRNGNTLVEFEDGHRMITTRWGVRRLKGGSDD